MKFGTNCKFHVKLFKLKLKLDICEDEEKSVF